MKNSIFSLCLMFVAITASSKLFAQVTSGAQIEFNKESHDYGTIKNGSDGTCTFEFKNVGNSPLIIQDAKGSCGCTVPDWPKEPIAPGAKGVITVKYDTKRAGVINKSVTVMSNATNEPTATLRIKGNVLPVPGGGAPVNNAGAPSN